MAKHNKKKQKNKFYVDKKPLLIGLSFGILVSLVFAIGANSFNSWRRQQADHRQPLTVTNLTYCNGEKLDLFIPQSTTKLPLVIYIHGGGWQYGSKVGGSLDLATPLLKKNIAVASINYRLSTNKKFPAQVQDVLCAVRYLRFHANQFNINGGKIGLIGISAGAHLATLAANAYSEVAFQAGGYNNVSGAVQSIVSINGLFNLNSDNLNQKSRDNLKQLLNSATSAQKTQASPQYYLKPFSPAQLIIYSQNDELVNPRQSQDYVSLAQSQGVNIRSLSVNNADHNLNTNWLLPSRPNKSQIKVEIVKFFEQNL